MDRRGERATAVVWALLLGACGSQGSAPAPGYVHDFGGAGMGADWDGAAGSVADGTVAPQGGSSGAMAAGSGGSGGDQDQGASPVPDPVAPDLLGSPPDAGADVEPPEPPPTPDSTPGPGESPGDEPGDEPQDPPDEPDDPPQDPDPPPPPPVLCADVAPLAAEPTHPVPGRVLDCQGAAPCDDGVSHAWCDWYPGVDAPTGCALYAISWEHPFPDCYAARDHCVRVRDDAGCYVQGDYAVIQSRHEVRGFGWVEMQSAALLGDYCPLRCP